MYEKYVGLEEAGPKKAADKYLRNACVRDAFRAGSPTGE